MLKANSLLKTYLTKFTVDLHLTWPQLLPLAKANLRALLQVPTFPGLFECMYDRPVPLQNLPTSQEIRPRADLSHFLCISDTC